MVAAQKLAVGQHLATQRDKLELAVCVIARLAVGTQHE